MVYQWLSFQPFLVVLTAHSLAPAVEIRSGIRYECVVAMTVKGGYLGHPVCCGSERSSKFLRHICALVMHQVVGTYIHMYAPTYIMLPRHLLAEMHTKKELIPVVIVHC